MYMILSQYKFPHAIYCQTVLNEEDQIYSLAAMPGWRYVDTLASGNATVLMVDQVSHAFVPAGSF